MKKQNNANCASGNPSPQYAKHLSSILWMLAYFIIFFLVGGKALAQEPLPSDLEVSIAQFDAADYPQITLYVNVTDSEGDHVTNLTQADFVVKEDDEQVEVSGFAGIGEQRPVDVVYVFDTTGSMGDEITGVIQTSIAFADELESKGRDYRLGLVTFSDQVRAVYHEDGSLTDNAEVFKGWVSGLKAEGGDEDPENDYAALLKALQMTFRDEAQKIIILITDAPPHHYGDPEDGGQNFDDPQLDYQPVLDALMDKNEEFIKLENEGVLDSVWSEMTDYALSKGWKKGDYKKLNLPFEEKLIAQPEEICERMIRRVEDFVYDLLINVFNSGDSAPLAINAILQAGSHDLGAKVERLEDPANWTENKIIEKGSTIHSDKGPEGDFDD